MEVSKRLGCSGALKSRAGIDTGLISGLLSETNATFSVGLERSGKPIRQDALVIRFFNVHSLTAPLQLIHFLES